MRYQDRIYIQNAHSCIRNKDHLNINMSSDICVFNQPTFIMDGADKIMSGVTVSDTEVHIITGNTEIDLTFTFTGNVETFIDTNASFKYSIYKFNNSTNIFDSISQYDSPNIEYNTFSATSAFTNSILVSNLNVDGEYLIKGSYDFTMCTEIMENLGESINTALPLTGDEHSIYNSDFDYYFTAINKSVKPKFALSPTDTRTLGALTVESFVLSGESEVTTTSNWSGQPIVALNGLTFAEGEDYTLNDKTITFIGPTSIDDIVTVSYVNNGNPNGLVGESMVVNYVIVSGVTDGEGSEVIYYNTDIGKYEIYLLADPIEFNDVVVTLNGVTLANNLDYTQSLVNPRRLILSGTIYGSEDLEDGLVDVITMTYNSYGTYAGTILVDIFDLYWTVTPPPINTEGQFITLVAEDDTFSSIIFSANTPYIANETSYNVTVDLSSFTGTSATYKVINQKDYILISGDTISTFTDSEIIPIEINT